MSEDSLISGESTVTSEFKILWRTYLKNEVQCAWCQLTLFFMNLGDWICRICEWSVIWRLDLSDFDIKMMICKTALPVSATSMLYESIWSSFGTQSEVRTWNLVRMQGPTQLCLSDNTFSFTFSGQGHPNIILWNNDLCEHRQSTTARLTLVRTL